MKWSPKTDWKQEFLVHGTRIGIMKYMATYTQTTLGMLTRNSGLSRSTIIKHILKLEAAGFIKRTNEFGAFRCTDKLRAEAKKLEEV